MMNATLENRRHQLNERFGDLQELAIQAKRAEAASRPACPEKLQVVTDIAASEITNAVRYEDAETLGEFNIANPACALLVIEWIETKSHDAIGELYPLTLAREWQAWWKRMYPQPTTKLRAHVNRFGGVDMLERV